MYGADPIEICFGQNRKREAGLFVFHEDEFNRRITEQTENMAMAEVIFSYIKDYGLMSSSMFINEAIIKAIKLNLPSIGDYLDN